jgi:hypothetical protein
MKRYVKGQKVVVRLPESERGKADGGPYNAIFLEYVGEDQCRLKWPQWGVGFSPEEVVELDNVTQG